jgi:hypothetical protein
MVLLIKHFSCREADHPKTLFCLLIHTIPIEGIAWRLDLANTFTKVYPVKAQYLE